MANYAQRLKSRPAFIQTFIEAVEQAADPICITDSRGRIEYVNHAFEKVTGYTQKEWLGNSLSMVKSGKHNAAFYKRLWVTIKSGRIFRDTMINRNKAGNLFYVDETITPLKDNFGEVSYFLTTWKDITKQHRLEKHVRYQAYRDPLTKLPNRSLLHDRLEIAIKKAKRAHKEIAVLFLDLDKFKPINDVYGHNVGDQVLQAVAKQLKLSLRESDTAARLGGDEFIIVLEDIENAADAVKVAKKIIKKMSKLYLGKQMLKIGASIGIAFFPDHGSKSNALIANADLALRNAKRNGGNRCEVYGSDHKEWNDFLKNTSSDLAKERR